MKTRFVLLCEDEQIACFIRRFLKEPGVARHEIRERIAPCGLGSGEQWVRCQYPRELTAVRAQDAAVLIVGADADVLSVGQRVATLDDACRKSEVPPRGPDDRVAMIVPKRNIETWLAYLRGEAVDETGAYRRYDCESDCRDDVRALDRMCREGMLGDPAPPSLRSACEEYRRIGPA